MNVVPLITPDSFDYRAYLAETEPQVKVLGAEVWEKELIASLATSNTLTGARLPWARTHDRIRFRRGEVTLWAGINGHGKSQLLGQVSIGFANQGERVCLASLEMSPMRSLGRMLRQTAGNDHPSEQAAHSLMAWAKGRYWFYDQRGTVKPEMIYAVIRYCAQRLKIRHIIIDSLMKCMRGEDDYNGQKDFVDALCTLARDHNVHIHLVHHMRKGEDENRIPGKFDAKGSGAISDQVDQMIVCWRNKKKENMVHQLVHDNKPVPDEMRDKPDEMLSITKNRNGEWEGFIPLWYHPQSMQYVGDKRCIPLDMIGSVGRHQ